MWFGVYQVCIKSKKCFKRRYLDNLAALQLKILFVYLKNLKLAFVLTLLDLCPC